jgi:predicted DCC family thiol-disulfide oxidoreductase YuxK
MRLVLLYDAECAVCVRCRELIEARESLVPLRFVACRSQHAKNAYAAIPFLVHELVVVDDDTGRWWAGSSAFVMTLWALSGWRWLAELLLTAPLLPTTHAVFSWITAHRADLAWIVGAPSCENGACELPTHAHARAIYR